jgi:hypothetical protein
MTERVTHRVLSRCIWPRLLTLLLLLVAASALKEEEGAVGIAVDASEVGGGGGEAVAAVVVSDAAVSWPAELSKKVTVGAADVGASVGAAVVVGISSQPPSVDAVAGTTAAARNATARTWNGIHAVCCCVAGVELTDMVELHTAVVTLLTGPTA